MKKLGLKIYIALFLIVCMVPALGMFVQGKVQPVGNEILQPAPKLTKSGKFNTEVLVESSDYIADHFALRRPLASLWAGLNASVFNTSVEEQIMLGKDGWLFYTDTAEDCMGMGLDDGLLRHAANNLSLIQEYLESEGMDFCFVIAPNKGSLYPEMLPDYVKGDRSGANAVRLLPMLEQCGVNTADLFSAFENEEILYYETDSHWNSKGAALGADEILRSLGRDSNFYFGSFVAGEEHRGDLHEMLYPAGSHTETNLVPSEAFSFTSLKDTAGGNAINIQTENPAAEGRLFCWRDSFGVSLYPYLAESFQTAQFSRSFPYELPKAAELGADCVVIELVERNLEQLLSNAAVFPAPTRDVAAQQNMALSLGCTADSEKSGLKHFHGKLSGIPVDDGSSVYVQCGGNVFEAMVTADEALGFSLWLPADGLAPTAVLCYDDGILCSYELILEDK